jgi:hypothetical protein
MSENESRLIAEFDKNSMEMIKVHLTRWRNVDYIDVRVWFKADDGGYHPSTKGIRLNVEHLADLADALEKARAAADGGVEIVQDGQGAGERR